MQTHRSLRVLQHFDAAVFVGQKDIHHVVAVVINIHHGHHFFLRSRNQRSDVRGEAQFVGSSFRRQFDGGIPEHDSHFRWIKKIRLSHRIAGGKKQKVLIFVFPTDVTVHFRGFQTQVAEGSLHFFGQIFQRINDGESHGIQRTVSRGDRHDLSIGDGGGFQVHSAGQGTPVGKIEFGIHFLHAALPGRIEVDAKNLFGIFEHRKAEPGGRRIDHQRIGRVHKDDLSVFTNFHGGRRFLSEQNFSIVGFFQSIVIAGRQKCCGNRSVGARQNIENFTKQNIIGEGAPLYARGEFAAGAENNLRGC